MTLWINASLKNLKSSEYWKRKGIDWGIVTELEVPKEMAMNISFVHSYADLNSIEDFNEFSEADIDIFSVHLISTLLTEDRTVRSLYAFRRGILLSTWLWSYPIQTSDYYKSN